MNALKSFVALAIIAALPVAGASADTITISRTLGPGIYDFNATSHGRTYGYFAGQLMLTDQTTQQSYAAYCVDFFNYLRWTESMQLLPIASYPSGGAPPAAPWAVAGSGKKIGWLVNQVKPAETDANLFAGAVQLAIWEVAYESSGYSLLNGPNFRAWNLDPTVSSIAAGLLRDLNRNPLATGDGVWFNGIGDSTNSQDFVSATPVPEPASVLLFGTGLVGFGRALRRRTTK